jgi:Leucine-rich repeat (LRR) protein
MKQVESQLRDLSLEEMLQRAKRTYLKELKLVNYSLTDVPSAVWMSTRLHELDMSKNRLRILPRELTKLENLSALYLNENEIEELDSEIFDGLNNLEILEVAQNMIRDIPVRCVHQHNLQILVHELYLCDEIADGNLFIDSGCAFTIPSSSTSTSPTTSWTRSLAS